MPQMAPLNWLTLFFYFILIFLMFNSVNYFNMLKLPQKSKFLKNFNLINWKW
uniref:ATP synthase complex subunit 8 n=1 Tax=Anthribidae sp. 6 ACP-2013 TaxID=1434433 RepID=A0A3G5FN98_9CUCU|nr:ATP synthase F0 subunit 8 [Anthribidae sp. 6 ACP-2013]